MWDTIKAVATTIAAVCVIGVVAVVIYWGAIAIVLCGLLLIVFAVAQDYYDSKEG